MSHSKLVGLCVLVLCVLAVPVAQAAGIITSALTPRTVERVDMSGYGLPALIGVTLSDGTRVWAFECCANCGSKATPVQATPTLVAATPTFQAVDPITGVPTAKSQTAVPTTKPVTVVVPTPKPSVVIPTPEPVVTLPTPEPSVTLPTAQPTPDKGNCGMGNGTDPDTPGCPNGTHDGSGTAPGLPGTPGPRNSNAPQHTPQPTHVVHGK